MVHSLDLGGESLETSGVKIIKSAGKIINKHTKIQKIQKLFQS